MVVVVGVFGIVTLVALLGYLAFLVPLGAWPPLLVWRARVLVLGEFFVLFALHELFLVHVVVAVVGGIVLVCLVYFSGAYFLELHLQVWLQQQVVALA